MAEQVATQTVADFTRRCFLQEQQLRVLAVIPGQETETSFVFVRRQLAVLLERGLDVRTLHLVERSSLVGIFREWRRLRQEIRAIRPDVVHAQYGTVTAFLCAIASNTPLVVTYRGSDLNGCPGIGRVRNVVGPALSQLASLRCNHVICVSEGLREKLWWRRDNASVVPSGIDLQAFRPLPRDEVRQRLGWRLDEQVVLFNLGNEPLLKGLDLAQKTVEAANGHMGQIRLHVVNGEVRPDSMPLHINAADCVLVCSVKEGSPNIVKEALACNVPVVSVDVGDVRQQAEGVFPGAVVSSRDPGVLSRALVDTLLLRTRSNGRNMIRHIANEILCEKLLKVYKEVLAQ